MNLITIILSFIIIVIILTFVMSFIETKIIFQPRKIKDYELEDIKMLLYYIKPIKNIKIITNDANVLDALYYKHPKINRLIIHAHGNAGNMYSRIDLIEKYKDYGSVLIFDYRGY